MKIQNGHLHAWSVFGEISGRHFWYLWLSLAAAKLWGCKSVTAHLPLEIQHSKYFRDKSKAGKFIHFGEWWKRMLKIRLYWENAPLLNYGRWDLKCGQTEWKRIPGNIELCLDTGHVMLGSRGKKEAVVKIRKILKNRGGQIKHLHIHENDLRHDLHHKPNQVLSQRLMRDLKKKRTFVYEK